MPILMRATLPGMDAATYDSLASPLIPELKKQQGFVLHAAYPTDDGFVVAKIWDSAEQHDRGFEAKVKPNLPADAMPAMKLYEIHALERP